MCVMSHRKFYLALFYIFLLVGLNNAARIRVQNRCNVTVWVGIQALAGHPTLRKGGFKLRSGDLVGINPPKKWSGRFWGRQGCFFDENGVGSCLTGDCGGVLECGDRGWEPPATVAEFTLDSPVDYFNISLVDGYNLPLSIIPVSGSGKNCQPVKCLADIISKCPTELQIIKNGKVRACTSACQAFNQPQYCCSGFFSSFETCEPSEFSRFFKSACPQAYSYAFDNKSHSYTCSSNADYFVRFC